MGRINWRKYGLLIFSLPVVVILFCASAFSSLLAPYEPYYLDVMYMLESPSSVHLFGTDELGRDVLSRTIYASQISIAKSKYWIRRMVGSFSSPSEASQVPIPKSK